MAFTRIVWDGNRSLGADMHVLHGQVSRRLDTRLVLSSDDDGSMWASEWRDAVTSVPPGPLPPSFLQVTSVQFVPIFPFTLATHGIDVNPDTGIVAVNGTTPPSATVRNFIIEARVAHTNPALTSPLVLPIRMHIHDHIVDVQLTPSIIGIRINNPDATNGPRLRILAQFRDDNTVTPPLGDTVGDLTFAWAEGTKPAWNSSNPAHVTIDTDGRIASSGPVGIAPRPTIGCMLPADFGHFVATPVEVDTLPAWSTSIPVKLVAGSAGRGKMTVVPNILFLSDGFLPGQELLFEQYVVTLVEQIKKNALLYPMNQIASKMNFWFAFVPVNGNHQDCASVLNLLRFTSRTPGDEKCESMPVPSPPPVIAAGPPPVVNITDVRHLLYQVGLPLPSDNVAPGALAAHQTTKTNEWTGVYGSGHINGMPPKIFEDWCKLGDSTLSLDRNTALGTKTGGHFPQVWFDDDGRFIGMNPLRTTKVMLDQLINNLNDGGINIGTLWTDTQTAEKNRIFVLSAGTRWAGTAGNPIYQSIADFAPVLATPVAGTRFIEVRPYAIPATASLVTVTVTTHETAHTFKLGDEYGSGIRVDPGHIENERADKSFNLTRKSKTEDTAGNIQRALIKWNWPRMAEVAVLTGQPSGIVQVELTVLPKRGRRFAVGQTVRLRHRPLDVDFYRRPSVALVIDEIVETVSGDIIRTTPAAPLGNPADYPAGTLVYRPVIHPQGPGQELNLIFDDVAAHLETTNTPLNRVAPNACAPSHNPQPAHLPGGLPPGRPKFTHWVIGLYDGGAEVHCGIYHPAGTCIMRNIWTRLPVPPGSPSGTLGKPVAMRFCFVCRYALVDIVAPWLHRAADLAYAEQYPVAP